MPNSRLRQRKIEALLIWGGLVLPLLFYVLSFWGEITRTLGYFWRWFTFMFGYPAPVLNPALSRDLQVTFFTLFIGFLLPFFLWLLLTSFQAILPVEDLFEVFQTMEHQLFYISGMHGQAVFIKDGVKLATAEEVNRVGPGVLVVDFNSAVVLERLVGPPTSIVRPLVDLFRRMAQATGVTRHYGAPIVHGPGLIFTLPYERIRGVVDLRKQSRRLKEISAYTRDGIELKSNVFAVFSIGQEPDVLQMAYIGDRRLENLRVISTETLPGDQIRVRVLEDEELDSDDLQEIHRYARVPNQANDSVAYAALPAPSLRPVFDKARVFLAVFAQARDLVQDKLLPWTELPARIAADIYRETLSRINYDDLYRLENPDPRDFPLPEVKRNFRMTVRNTGILSFRVVFLRSGHPLVNGIYPASELLCSPILPLTSPHVLRERGIKVITSGFSNPIPSEEVYQQRLNAWRAHWERDREIVKSSRELEATRIRNRARALAQRELTFTLSKIFERTELTDEILAIRVLQSLEAVAVDPKTREFLPGDTIKLMEQVHKWLTDGAALSRPAPTELPAANPPPVPPTPAAPGGQND